MTSASSPASLSNALFDALSRAEPSRAFIEWDGQGLSFGQFLIEVGARQAQLASAGIDDGTHVLVVSGRGFAFWVDLVALWGLNAVVIPLEPGIHPTRAESIVAKGQPEFMLGSTLQWQGQADLERTAIITVEELASANATLPPRDEGQSSSRGAILFTSGSTGEPKGVDLSQHALLENARGTQAIVAMQENDRLLVSVPFHFTTSICHFLACALAQATFLASETKWLHADLFKHLKTQRANCFGGAPVQLRWIGECAASQPIKLRWLFSSGDHLPPEVIHLLRQNLPASEIFTVYGLTEVGGRFCILPPADTAAHLGKVGVPIAGLSIDIVDDDGTVLGTGETGEVRIQGQSLFNGYYNDHEKTTAVVSDGKFRTGDMGWLDEHGRLSLVGRNDDVFKSAGQKVSTVPISDALMKTGFFNDVVVIPNELEGIGLVPWAYYTLKDGTEFKKGLVLRSLRAVLSSNYLPREFRELSHIPRTGSGKIDRKALRELITATT